MTTVSKSKAKRMTMAVLVVNHDANVACAPVGNTSVLLLLLLLLSLLLLLLLVMLRVLCRIKVIFVEM